MIPTKPKKISNYQRPKSKENFRRYLLEFGKPKIDAEPYRPSEALIKRETNPQLKKHLVVQSMEWKAWVRSKLPKFCKICKATENLTIDHIRPVSKGGSHKLKNLQTLCERCNVEKGDKWE